MAIINVNSAMMLLLFGWNLDCDANILLDSFRSIAMGHKLIVIKLYAFVSKW